MIVVAWLAAAFVAGAAAGAAYLCALWAAGRYLPYARHGGPRLLARGILRIGLLFAVCVWVFGGRWDQIAACVLGFAAVRLLATRWPAFRIGMPADLALRPMNGPD